MSPFGPRKAGSQSVMDRIVFRWAALAAVLVMVVGALVIALQSQRQANKVRSTCLAWQIVATAPITPKTTATGLTLIGAGRIAYLGLGCGDLPPVDPRVTAAVAAAVAKGNH